MREAIKSINASFGGCVFKPGYPTGRGEFMIAACSDVQHAIIAAFAGLGWCCSRVPCGHDYNYGGDLYKLIKAGVR